MDVFLFVMCCKIGSFVLGKLFYELIIGEDIVERKVYVNVFFYVNEWIIILVVLKWCKEYCVVLCKNKMVFGYFVFDIFSWILLLFVLFVNFDGVDFVFYGCEDLLEKSEFFNELNEYCLDFCEWKVNINGVDLNKYFLFNWDIEQRCKLKVFLYWDFLGMVLFIELEVQVMYWLIIEQLFDRVIVFYMQG